MLREANVQSLTWAEKTMSVIRTRELEACDQRLAVLPSYGLFSKGCDDAKAEELWRLSYDAQEHPFSSHLHSLEELRQSVLEQAPTEFIYLSPREHHLLERVFQQGGSTILGDWSESALAESLVRRLWCTIEQVGEDGLRLSIANEIVDALTPVLTSTAARDALGQLLNLNIRLYGMLYQYGALHYTIPLSMMLLQLSSWPELENKTLMMRHLRVAFDYVYDNKGDLLILHPGVTDPERLLPFLTPQTEESIDAHMTGISIQDVLANEEWNPTHALMGQIADYLRPEITPNAAAEDLLMLAKQGVSLQEMQEVLSSMLTRIPTHQMQDAVRVLKTQVSCWGRIPTGMVQ